MNYWLILIPLVSAFIGWFTNWIAIKMLFHPRHPKKFFGFTIQGVLPKHQATIATRLTQLISDELTSFDIGEKISNPENFKKIIPVIDTHIEDFLRKKLPAEMPVISMFIGDKTVNKMKAIFLQEIEALFPKVMQQFAVSIKTELNIEHTVYTRISSFTSDKLERTLHQFLSKELRLGGLLMAGIGFIIGIFELVVLIIVK